MTRQAFSAERKENLRERMKKERGWTDRELDNLSPKQWERLDRTGRLVNYKMIAEVVQESHCAFKPKKGDKFVFHAGIILVPEESTFPTMCLWALARIFPYTFMIIDRICEGLDPNGIWYDHVKCADTGAGCGGLGEVLFKIYCEQVPTEQRCSVATFLKGVA
jgi:uncharacterized repeat protein (TIGR04076 family)